MSTEPKFSAHGFNICLGISMFVHVLFFSWWNIRDYTDFNTEIPFISVKLNFSGGGGRPSGSGMQKNEVSAQIDKMIVREMEKSTSETYKKLREIKVAKNTVKQEENQDKQDEKKNSGAVISEAENLDYNVGRESTMGSYNPGRNFPEGEAKPEVVVKYEQALSLWLEKNKVLPPRVGANGRNIEAVLRIRIDRTGRLKFHRLEKSSGDPVVDSAINQMVIKSDPFPAVPEDYPQGNPIDFLIPLRFSLD